MAVPVKSIAIFGAGGGGTSAAAHLTTLGFEIRLYSQDESALSTLQEIGGIEYDAPFGKGFAKIPVITSDAAAAIVGAELVMIVSPAHLHEKWITAAAPYLTGSDLVRLTRSYLDANPAYPARQRYQESSLLRDCDAALSLSSHGSNDLPYLTGIRFYGVRRIPG
jgi:predicted dinucleotide-binding enzyme